MATSRPPDTQKEVPRRKSPWLRWLPLAALGVAVALALAFNLQSYLSFEALRDNRVLLLDWVNRHGALAPLAYMALYAGVVALSLPGATLMTLAGGFLFGAVGALAYTVIGATIGATIIFCIASTAFGDCLAQKAGPAVRKMEAGFQENAFSYMLVLRLVPLFPFWLVNLVPALLDVRLSTYVFATFIGIIPGTFVYCLAGAGLGSVFESGDEFSLAGVLTPTLIGALIGLALLSLVPVVYRQLKRNH